MQKVELDRDIERLQASVQTGQATITTDKLKALSLAMQTPCRRPPELRQAYMHLILDSVTIDRHDVRLKAAVVLGKLSQTGASKSLPEVLLCRSGVPGRIRTSDLGLGTRYSACRSAPHVRAKRCLHLLAALLIYRHPR